MRGGGRRLRQGISNWIGEASSVLYSEGKLGEKSQLALLSGRLGWRKAVENGYQRFVIREEEERTTLKMKPELKEGRIGCLKFTVKR